jgi:rhamnulokinase
VPPGGPVVDADDERFLPPGDMPTRIAEAARATGARQALDPDDPADHAAVVRCIVDSLAAAYARTVAQAAEIASAPVDVIHVVGGGSQNTLLCQLTADLAGIPVTAGPVEATALGNVLVQARARGVVPPTLEEIRSRLVLPLRARSFLPMATV